MQSANPLTGLRAHISDDRLSKISRLRRLWFEINELKAEGVTDAMLVEALAKTGVSFTSRSSFSTTLARVRKEIQEGKFHPSSSVANAPPAQELQPAELSRSAEASPPATAKTPLPVPDPPQTGEPDIYKPRLSKKEMREQKASRINLDTFQNNPLLISALKEQNT